MNCADIQSEHIEKYLLGELSEEEAHQLEKHYFSCNECFEALEEYSALRSELADDRWAVRAETPSAGVRWGWAWTVAVVLVGIGLGLWLWSQGPVKVHDAELVRLSAIGPAPYQPKTLRSSASEGEEQFHKAMLPYQEGDYPEAIRRLDTFVELDPESWIGHFYLGVSYLLTDQPEPAVEILLEATQSPLMEERARFYLGKAYLAGLAKSPLPSRSSSGSSP